MLFPGFGWRGLIALILTLEFAATRPWMLLVLVMAGVVGSFAPDRPAPSNWAAVQTHFGNIFRDKQQLQVIEEITDRTNRGPHSVVIWPESMVDHFNQATEAFWPALAKGKTVAFGATLSNGRGLRNVVMFRGTDAPTPVDERFPVPVAMWQPFANRGVELNLHSPVRNLAGQRAAFFICYEQLLAAAYLPLLLEQPTILVAQSNTYWVRNTHIPTVQQATLRSWARLFGVPYLQAVNQ